MTNTMNNSIKLVAGFASMALALSVAAADVTVGSGGTATLSLSKKISHAPAVPGDLNHDGYFDGIDIDLYFSLTK